MATATFLIALCCFQVASGVIHTHQYYFTATSGIPNFPEFVVVGVVDGQQFGQYDSFTKRMVPKEWLANEGDYDHWNSETENAAGAEAVFKVDIRDLTSRFNQTEVIHTHQYFDTATSGIPNFPEFVAVGVVDGQQFAQYDSFTKRMVPKEWMANEGDSDHWNWETEKIAQHAALFKIDIGRLTSRFNQTEGVHTWQWMFGCQWDDESNAVDGYNQYGYDGEDWISMDLKNLRYIAANQRAVLTINNWDNSRNDIDYLKYYYSEYCLEWLKKYVQYANSTLGRTVSPEVTLFQKDSRVVCHSTGFYPDGVVITWKRDGEDLHEDVNMWETLPNEDGTFQKRAELTVSPEERKKGHFTCEVEHRSGKPIVKTLIVEDGKNLVGIIIGCVIVIGVVVAIVIMKKKGYNKASQSDAGSDTSAPLQACQSSPGKEPSVVTAEHEE